MKLEMIIVLRALGVGACTWIFEINKDKDTGEALKIADTVLIASERK